MKDGTGRRSEKYPSPFGSQSGLLAWREDSHPMSQPRSLWFSAVSQTEPAKILPPLTR